MHLTGTFSRTGSSPLARGLPSHHDRRASSGRIIPARAGFTRGAFWPRPRSRDHPRSRGVYEMCLTGAFSREGSSPLARGLLLQVETGADPSEDHPRSRGVYSSSGDQTVSNSGSSPLARGLLARPGHRPNRKRIIPARAGFTTRPEFWQGGGLGSSPLARGLQPEDGRGGLLGRIIPARAGFTFFMPSSPSRMPDHPRSRGVYMGTPMVARRQPGSSPLARGLPPLHGSGPDRHRIIPARAGFTRRGRHPAEGDADHPRSRGVYDSEFFTIASRAGSSPLAWGLPRV